MALNSPDSFYLHRLAGRGWFSYCPYIGSDVADAIPGSGHDTTSGGLSASLARTNGKGLWMWCVRREEGNLVLVKGYADVFLGGGGLRKSFRVRLGLPEWTVRTTYLSCATNIHIFYLSKGTHMLFLKSVVFILDVTSCWAHYSQIYPIITGPALSHFRPQRL